MEQLLRMVRLQRLPRRRNPDPKVVRGKGPSPETENGLDPDLARGPRGLDLGTEDEGPEAEIGEDQDPGPETGEGHDPEITRVRRVRGIVRARNGRRRKRSRGIMIRRNKDSRTRKRKRRRRWTWRFPTRHK